MLNETNDGAAYLQALKQSDKTPAGAAAAPVDSPHAQERADQPPPPAGPERRRSVRYKCEGRVEITQEGLDVRTWASFTDISMHGCYVEASATYPVGTHLQLKLAANGFDVNAQGIVRVNYPQLGMGIALTEMSVDDRNQLRNLLQTASRRSVIMGPGIVSSTSAGSPPGFVPLLSDPFAAVQALIRYFEDRQVLLRDEFLRIIQASQAESKPTVR